ncbi:MAG: hypothetical protein ABIV39_15895, partial [Verrucomicrobiota bacterium]
MSTSTKILESEQNKRLAIKAMRSSPIIDGQVTAFLKSLEKSSQKPPQPKLSRLNLSVSGRSAEAFVESQTQQNGTKAGNIFEPISGSTITMEEILACLKAIEPLFGSMVEQLRGDWTSTEGQKEQKQTFEEFSKRHKPPAQERMSIGFLRIGRLPDDIQIERLAEVVRAYLCVDIRDLGQIQTTDVPEKAWRTFGDFVPQMHESVVLDDVLLPRLGASSDHGLIALTN